MAKDITTTTDTMSCAQLVKQRDTERSENKRESDQRCALLERQLAAERAGCEQRDAAIGRALEQKIAERNAKYGCELQAALEPIVIARNAAAFRTACVDFDKLLVEKVGEGLWPTAPVLAIAKQRITRRAEFVNVLAHSEGRLAELGGPLANAIRLGDASVEHAISVVERGLDELEASSSIEPASEHARARFAVKLANPTYSAVYKALAVVDAEQTVTYEAAAAKSHAAELAAEREKQIEPLANRAYKALEALVT